MMTLSDWLATHGGQISVAVIDGMYADDPFWLERFGERGQRFAREDGGFHIRHLVTALDIERDEVMASYARWLRSVLVSRGMASWHLVDNFRRLAVALAEAAPMSTSAATRALEAGVVALAHDHPAARLLATREDELIATWLRELDSPPTNEHRTDAVTLMAFMGDSLALTTRALSGYVAYRTSHPTPRGLWALHAPARLRDTLLAVVQRTLPNEEGNNIVSLLETHWGS